MSAEVLRRAAALMRERAGAARSWDGNWRVHPDRPGRVIEIKGDGWDDAIVASCVDYGGTENGTEKAAHIASWSPDVVLAVAQMLEGVADRHEWMTVQSVDYSYTACRQCHHEPSQGFEDDDDPCPDVVAALAVARTYLGEQP